MFRLFIHKTDGSHWLMPKTTFSARSATHTDLLIAERLRVKRTELGVSQQALAALVGVTFQQVQKYEKGSNRVSASRLLEIARALDVPITYFFEPFQRVAAATAKKSQGAGQETEEAPVQALRRPPRAARLRRRAERRALARRGHTEGPNSSGWTNSSRNHG